MSTDAKPSLTEVEHFEKSSLHSVQTQEKNKGAFEGYAQEKALKEVSNFAKEKLKHVDTAEKNPLPTQQEIEAEKKSGF